jgi:2-hydroxychromene-2-carboxylate isomerase
MRDFARSARFEGLPIRMPESFPLPTQNAARIFWWQHDTVSPEAAAAWSRAAFRAMFTRGVLINDAAALKTLAGQSALDADAAEAAWNDPRWKARLKAECDAAITGGMFGAPWIVVDGEPFWGNDRKPQVERWLAQGPF